MFMRWCLFLALCIFTVGHASAEPGITSTSGSWSHDNSVVITGSDFRTKSLAAPVIWDNCESGSVADTWSKPRPYTATDSTFNMQYRTYPYRSVTAPHTHSNSKCATGGHAEASYNPYSAARGGIVGLGGTMASSDTYYITCYYRLDPLWPKSDLSGVNHKIFYVANSGSWYTADYWYMAYRSGFPELQGDTGVTFHSGFAPCSYYPEISMNNPRTQWVRLEFYGGPNMQRAYTDNKLGFTKYCADSVNDYNFIGVGGYWRQKYTDRTYGNDNAFRYFEDIYVDNTFSRVVLTNDQIYADATIIEPQPPASWSDKSITVTVNLGKLPDSGTAYLFVFDADNNQNSAGYPVTLGSGGGESLVPTGFDFKK